jgi:hypothetical protein
VGQESRAKGGGGGRDRFNRISISSLTQLREQKEIFLLRTRRRVLTTTTIRDLYLLCIHFMSLRMGVVMGYY